VGEPGRGQGARGTRPHEAVSSRPPGGAPGRGRPLRVSSTLLLLLLALVLPGCGPEEPLLTVRTEDPSAPPEAIGSFGLITLLPPLARASEGPCLKLTGQFVHFTQLRAEEVLRAIDPELGRLPNEGIPGQCRLLPPEEHAPTLSARQVEGSNPFTIDLLDAGPLAIRSPEVAITVEPTPFPDLLASVAGVVYGAAAEECIPLGGEGDLIVQTQGGPDVGPFTAVLPLPRPVTIQAVDEIPPDEGCVLLGHRPQGSLRVRWDRSEEHGDFLPLELGSSTARLHCLVPDTGSFTVPLGPGLETEEGLRLRVRRIRVQPFLAPGIREGEMVTIVHDEVILRSETFP